MWSYIVHAVEDGEMSEVWETLTAEEVANHARNQMTDAEKEFVGTNDLRMLLLGL